MHYLNSIALLLSMKSIVAKEHNPPLYLTIHLCVSRIINNICLTPLLLSPSVCNLHYNKNAFFYLSLLAMCAPKMPNRNEKKGEAVWEWTLLKWVHSCGNELVSPNIVGVCQRFCCHYCLLHITCECFLSLKKEFYEEFDWKAFRKKIWIVGISYKSLEVIT